jgi:hypothetical protein
VAGLAGLLALGAAAEGPDPAAVAAASVAPGIRGILALEPGRIRAGEVASLEVVVTTPPEHVLRPVVPPDSVPGFWILGSEVLPTEKEDGRWVHRVRFRLRARELGQFVWPAQPVEIETPDGATQRLVIDGRPIEVVSVQPDFPGQDTPFGLRELPEAAQPRGSAWAAAAAGAVSGAAAVGLILLVRRARRRQGGEPVAERAPAADLPAARRTALDALGAAEQRLEAEPDAAADAVARALRRYVTERWGRDVQACTTPELEAATPPAGAAQHWADLVGQLRDLDDARFARSGERVPAGQAALRQQLARARDFVLATAPPAPRP